MLDERRHSRRNLGRGCGGLLSSSSGSRFEVGQSVNLLRQVKENSIFFLVSQYAKTKVIKREVVTEISSFISRHIFAKLAEFYFHTYGFFLKIELILYHSALKKNF